MTKVVRPSLETNAASRVDPYPATREPGSAAAILASRLRRSLRTTGSVTCLPAGSVTTGTSGGFSPPVPL